MLRTKPALNAQAKHCCVYSETQSMELSISPSSQRGEPNCPYVGTIRNADTTICHQRWHWCCPWPRSLMLAADVFPSTDIFKSTAEKLDDRLWCHQKIPAPIGCLDQNSVPGSPCGWVHKSGSINNLSSGRTSEPTFLLKTGSPLMPWHTNESVPRLVVSASPLWQVN